MIRKKKVKDILQISKFTKFLKTYLEENQRHYIIIKNIDENTSIEEIENFFKRCGDILNVYLMSNLYSGIQN
jgi:hypothetical protein